MACEIGWSDDMKQKSEQKYSTRQGAAGTHRHEKRLVAAATIFSMLANPAVAAISDVPLYLTSPVEPNIMFILDDSGSMNWDVVPDSDPVYFVFPRPDTLYGTTYSTGYGNITSTVGFYNGVARFDPANRFARYFRTTQYNPLYYNPGIRYRPWSNSDGTFMANAVPTAAPYNPMAAEGTLDLTTDATATAVWVNNDGTRTAGAVTYYPATYFIYTGPGVLTGPNDANNIQANFTRIEIRSTNAPFPKSAGRTDCAGTTCTYAEEIQNFANWFTYTRSRILASRAGIGKAFSQQGVNMRVGFGAINRGITSIDGVNTRTIIRGVRGFSGTNRTNFFNSLYSHPIPAAGTPLRRALDDAGQYYARTDNSGPWGAEPGVNNAAAHLQCRQSYSILMTDGYWNSGSGEALTAEARANVDGTSGPTISGPGSSTFTYNAVSPFSDGHSNTLADVAMYYWKRDLRTDLANRVPTNPKDPAFWQHMTTYGVGLGVTGSVNPATAFAAINGSPTITWPDPHPTTANAAKLDDLLHASVNGRGGFFTASNPDVFASELSNVLNNIEDRTSSASAVASNSTRLTSTTHLYQALFKSGDWTGQLKAFTLNANGSVGGEVWDAANGIPATGARNIKTWNGSAGVDFNGALGSLTASQVNYLRGDTSQEVRNGGTFRNREGRLGDIINADPHYVKNENFGYNVLSGSEGGSYSAFVNGKSSRTAVVYAAANDGMVHAFRASDGVEMFAYVPNAIWGTIGQLTSPGYVHKYFVDGSPTAWDAYWGGSWKTVLTGSLGAGGKAVYALNVSNPGSFGTGSVLWEYQGNNATEKANLGYNLGTVSIARFADGNYWAVFGNGYESTNGKAVLFMVRVDSPSTVKMIDVGAGTGNGMSTPALIDVNGDRIIDLVYAGDLKGNVWKFNVASSSSSSWGSAYGSSPLFQAKDTAGNPQPITSSIEIGLSPAGAPGLMAYFGTGKYFETGDNSTTSVQSVYGVVDADGNGGGTTGYFTGGNHRTQLQSQSIVFESIVNGLEVRAMSDNAVNYSTQKGWVINLLQPPSPGTAIGERVITTPMLFGGKLIFQTIIPSSSPCDYGGNSWLMQVSSSTGGPPNAAAFNINGDSLFNESDRVDIGGGQMVYVSGVNPGVGISGGFSQPIRAGDSAFVPMGGTAGTLAVPRIHSGRTKSRASWRQIQ